MMTAASVATEDPRRFLDPRVEYRPCPRLPADRYLFGRDGSAWYRRSPDGPWWRFMPVFKDGYAALYVRRSGVRSSWLLGPVILSAFGDPRPLGFECHYINGDRTDVRLCNLEWRRKGHRRRGKRVSGVGEECATAKLTREKVIEIRTLYSYGATDRDLAGQFGVDPRTIANAVFGRTWSHVPGAVARRRRIVYGSSNGAARLDEIDVREVWRLRREGLGYGRIARAFGVDQKTIQRIIKGITWIHVDGDAPDAGEDRRPECR